jgi:hypothetical protein
MTVVDDLAAELNCVAERSTSWEVIEIDGTHHVRPLDDLKPHEDLDCWCKPFDDEGVCVHNALDRREFIERGGNRH